MIVLAVIFLYAKVRNIFPLSFISKKMKCRVFYVNRDMNCNSMQQEVQSINGDGTKLKKKFPEKIEQENIHLT